jgi:hypothetical protein
VHGMSGVKPALQPDPAVGDDDAAAAVEQAPHDAPLVRRDLAGAVDDGVGEQRGVERAGAVRVEQGAFRGGHLQCQFSLVALEVLGVFGGYGRTSQRDPARIGRVRQ